MVINNWSEPTIKSLGGPTLSSARMLGKAHEDLVKTGSIDRRSLDRSKSRLVRSLERGSIDRSFNRSDSIRSLER